MRRSEQQKEGSHLFFLLLIPFAVLQIFSCSVTENGSAKLVASFSYNPPSPEPGQVVQFTDTSTGGPTSWQWNFGDGGTSTAQNPSHSFSTVGAYAVILTVSQRVSSDSSSQTVNIAWAPLNASFTYSPVSLAAGQVVQFTDTSTGRPTAWQWSFGDGGTSTAQNPSHTFASAGSYTVTLTVTNSTGSNSLSRTITVPASAVIPSDRLINWSQAGVYVDGVKGIPNRTAVFCNVKVSIPGSALVAKGDGVQDDTLALQTAFNSCPANQVVFIPQGTYRISDTLRLRSAMTVRGEGPDKTKIIQYSSEHIFLIQGSSEDTNSVSIVSGHLRGSDTVTVATAQNYEVGDVVMIDQLNDTSFVTQFGGGGACNWCGRYTTNGTRAMGETLLVKAINGNTIKFNRPLYYDYRAEFLPLLSRRSGNPIINTGIENLYIEAGSGSTNGAGVYMAYCAHCWVKNVESYNTPLKHVEITYGSYGNEVRDCYFHDAKYFQSDRGYGVRLFSYSCDNLIENNIFYHTHFPICIEAGGAGNVIAYNYSEWTDHYEPEWFCQHLGTHGAHPYMNLWEGNVAGMIQFDNYWGSASHQVVFRNHLTGQNRNAKNNICAAIVDKINYFHSFVGNLLGAPGYEAEVEQIPYKTTWMNPVLWKIGYPCCSATGYPTDPKTAETLLRTGNWQYPASAIQWTTSERTIPDSLYLTSKPAWFGSLPWPPFTPERPGFDPNNPNKIPAQLAYENGPKIGLPFNPYQIY